MSDASAPPPEPEQPQGDQAQSGPPTQPIPPAVAAQQPFGPPPAVSSGTLAAAQPPRRGVRGLWRDATSTTGGRIAAIVAATLGALVLLGIIGLGAAAVGHAVYDRNGSSVQAGPGQRGLPRQGQQGQQQPGPPGQQQPGLPGQQGQQGLGTGRGGLGTGGRLGGVLPRYGNGLLGDVLHGEFVAGTGGSGTSMLYQVGQVTAYTKGASLAVKSSDGFTATYGIDSSSRLVGSDGSLLVVGDQVRVLATKSGPTVTIVQLVRSGYGISSGSPSSPSSGTGA